MALQQVQGYGGTAQAAVPQRPVRAADAAAPAQTTPAPAQVFASPEQVSRAVKEIQQAVGPVAQDLQFSVDNETGRTVVRIVDSATQQVIRQIPTEEVLAISRAVGRMQGLLLRQKA